MPHLEVSEADDMRRLILLLEDFGIEYESKPWYDPNQHYEQVGWMVGIPTYIILYFDMRGKYIRKIGFNGS